jgi:hypothetical protein
MSIGKQNNIFTQIYHPTPPSPWYQFPVGTGGVPEKVATGPEMPTHTNTPVHMVLQSGAAAGFQV